jgi:fructose-specific phosphotransferase system IIA component
MILSQVLTPEVIELDLKSDDKNGVLEELVDLLVKADKIKEKETLLKALISREELMSTGIGNGIAIPHAKCNEINSPVVALGFSKKGINYDAIDKAPVYIIFLLVTPEKFVGSHIKALAKISRLLKHAHIREELKKITSKEDILALIRREERRGLI